MVDSRTFAQRLVFGALVLLASTTVSGAQEPVVPISTDTTPGFEPGAPAEMELLSWLTGSWDVEFHFRNIYVQEEQWMETGSQRVEYGSLYDGGFLRADYRVPWPDGSHWEWGMILSYDRFRALYRAAVWDDQWALLDIYEGELEEGGALVTSNEGPGTMGPGGPNGEFLAGSMAIRPQSHGFHLEWQAPQPDGEWIPLIRLVHRRPPV